LRIPSLKSTVVSPLVKRCTWSARWLMRPSVWRASAAATSTPPPAATTSAAVGRSDTATPSSAASAATTGTASSSLATPPSSRGRRPGTAAPRSVVDELVADAADGDDQLGVVRRHLDAAAQALDVHVQRLGVADVVGAPD